MSCPNCGGNRLVCEWHDDKPWPEVCDCGAGFERMEGGRFHTVHSATTKAVTAASNKRPSSSSGAAGQELDLANAVGLALAAGPERWTAIPGGCPILVNGECIGGIGVAGGDWQADFVLAKAAVESIGASWDPRRGMNLQAHRACHSSVIVHDDHRELGIGSFPT